NIGPRIVKARGGCCPTRSLRFLGMQHGSWIMEHCDRATVSALSRALGVSETVAAVLARRGYGEPDRAREFLDAAPPGHHPLLLGDVREAVDSIARAVAAGKRICVHGDYD